MTETKQTTTEQEAAEAPRVCAAGSKGQNPCWRPVWQEVPRVMLYIGEEPALCSEHYHARVLGEHADAALYALEATEEWIKGAVQDDPHGLLTERAYNVRDDLFKEAAHAWARSKAAESAAQVGPPQPGEVYPPLVVREQMGLLLHRSDALNNARGALIGDMELTLTQRLAVLEALTEASEAANEKAMRYREEQGFGK